MSSRRDLLKQALGLTAAVVSSKAIAEVCERTVPQTAGPFIPDDFPFRQPVEGAPWIRVADSDVDLTEVREAGGAKPKGQVLYVRGQVIDLNCQPVVGANVYLWQADDNGHYNHHEDPNVGGVADLDPAFQYRGIAVTDREGRFQFKTIKPKYYPLDESGSTMRTAHLHVTVMHPAIETLITQTYFEGDVLEDIERIRQLNRQDIILAPRGSIRSELKNLIIEFKADPLYTDGPVGDVRLQVKSR